MTTTGDCDFPVYPLSIVPVDWRLLDTCVIVGLGTSPPGSIIRTNFDGNGKPGIRLRKGNLSSCVQVVGAHGGMHH